MAAKKKKLKKEKKVLVFDENSRRFVASIAFNIFSLYFGLTLSESCSELLHIYAKTGLQYVTLTLITVLKI